VVVDSGESDLIIK